jgi:AcrR family transcriptional regulator
MRERVLDAAIACFVERGFEATTMQAIADRADVARATVFNHFPDKQSLLAGYLERRRTRVAELLALPADQGAVPAQRLVDVFDLLARENERDRAETRELVQAWLRTGGHTTSTSSEQLLAAIVVAGKERGELRGDVDADLAARILFDAYTGVVIRWAAVEPPPYPLRSTLRNVATAILDGLRE